MKTILLIEDETALSNALKIILEFNNFKVLVGHTGQEGLLLARNEKTDLILCDINLPDINGFQICHIVRQDKNLAHIPFMFLTAYTDDKFVKQGFAAGSDDYITKPFSSKDLLIAIKTRLQKGRTLPAPIIQLNE